jgi:hypothetical protein
MKILFGDIIRAYYNQGRLADIPSKGFVFNLSFLENIKWRQTEI